MYIYLFLCPQLLGAIKKNVKLRNGFGSDMNVSHKEKGLESGTLILARVHRHYTDHKQCIQITH